VLQTETRIVPDVPNIVSVAYFTFDLNLMEKPFQPADYLPVTFDFVGLHPHTGVSTHKLKSKQCFNVYIVMNFDINKGLVRNQILLVEHFQDTLVQIHLINTL
jgi:hypothetical protein